MGNDTDKDKQIPGANPNDLPPEAKEVVAILNEPIIKEIEASGLTLTKWVRGVVKLTKAKETKIVKVKKGLISADDTLPKHSKIIAETGEEYALGVDVVSLPIRLAAHQYVGKLTGWEPPAQGKVDLGDGALTLLYVTPKEQEVKVEPDDVGR